MPIIELPLPVEGKITSGFGKRKPPTTGASSDHRGIDIAAPLGAPVRAPLGGTVIMARFNGSAGNMVVLEHENNIVSGYLHLNFIAVVTNEKVTKGSILGYVGQTGTATGPHLHYFLQINGQYVDPVLYTKAQADQKEETKTGKQNHEPEVPPEIVNTRDYYQLITVDDKYTNTLQKFLDKLAIKMTVEELIKYRDNQKRILSAYTKKQLTENKGLVNPKILNLGTTLAIPLYKMSSRNPYRVNQNLLLENAFPAFIEGEVHRLIKSKTYRRLNKNQDVERGVFTKDNVGISVWLWSKALALNGEYLVDISAFCKNVSITVDENGGNFNIVLPHINFERSANGVTGFDFDIYKHQFQNYTSFVSKNITHKQEKSPAKLECDVSDFEEGQVNQFVHKRKYSLFHHLVQSNDVVFIRFEKLHVDSKLYNDDLNFLKINPIDLAGKVFDMIGLIDSNPITTVAKGSAFNVTFQGRDLSKLLIDEAVYFFPVEYAVKDSEQIIKNSTKQKSGKRLIATSGLSEDGFQTNNNYTLNGAIIGDVRFNFDQTQSIEDWLLFMFSQLTNIDICPDTLFTGYKDKTFVISKENKPDVSGNYAYKKILANGIWQICKLVTDKNFTDRRLADASLATDTGSLLNLVRKVVQRPFCELIMDTYGDKYYFIVRKYPFAENAYRTNKCINVYDYQISNDQLEFTSEVYTWFRLTPMGSIVDANDGSILVELPAVLLPEYSEIWGMKVLDVTTNYLDFDMSISSESVANIQNILKQGYDDLDWMIETNALLPFTRRGTINIKGGDRRIKTGMNIRLMSTGEIFYVEGVTNTGSFDNLTNRITTLRVSRGIVEKYYSKYFNIVNLRRNGRNTNTWTVNQEIFKFFLQRKQFD